MNEFNINGKKYHNVSFNDIARNPTYYKLDKDAFWEQQQITDFTKIANQYVL